MKRILFAIYIALSVFILLQGCAEDIEMLPPVLTLEKSEIKVNASADVYSLSYELENASEDYQLRAICDEDWIEEVVFEGKSISFSVRSNTQETARTNIIHIVSSDNMLREDLTVIQSGIGEEEKPVFQINITDVTETTIAATVTPADFEMTYMFMTIEKSFYDEIGSDDALFQVVSNKLKATAESSGLSLEDFLANHALWCGEKSTVIRNLDIKSEQILFAVGMDYEGNRTTDLVKEVVTTKELVMNNASFDIVIEIDSPKVMMKVSPSDNELRYFMGYILKKDAEGGDLRNKFQSSIDKKISDGLSDNKNIKDIIEEITVSGPAEKEYELLVRREYIAYAFSINKNGLIDSEIAQKDFTIESIPPSSNKITLKITEIGVDEVSFETVVTNEDPYVVVCAPAASCEGLEPEEIVEKITEKEDLSGYVFNGNTSDKLRYLESETEYIALAFGYRAGVSTTSVVTEKFTTSGVGNPEDLTFEFKITDVGENCATVEVLPTPSNCLYMWGIVENDVTSEDIIADLEEQINKMIEWGVYDDRGAYMRDNSSRGKDKWTETYLSPGTEYKVYAFGVYDESGELATEIVYSDVFKTEKAEVANVSVSLSYDKYYDGTEISAKYSGYERAVGSAVLPVSAEISGEAEHYFYAAIADDLSDTEKYPDYELASNISKTGVTDIDRVEFFVPYDTKVTLVAVGKDSEGKFGPVYRKVIVLDKDGVSPVDEFSPLGMCSMIKLWQKSENSRIM